MFIKKTNVSCHAVFVFCKEPLRKCPDDGIHFILSIDVRLVIEESF